MKFPKPSQLVADGKQMVLTDTTTRRVTSFVRAGAPKLPGATAQYLLAKLPIVGWLPHYHPSWLISDFIAGLTIGVMLIPQGLAYAKIATIPIENGLYSSWWPAAVAVFMGTSKDLSTGPTSILGLLTAEIVGDMKRDYAPAAIASAVAFMVGVYSLVLGLLELGWLLDFVSVPVLTGFISATACTIGFGQVGSLVGLDGVPSAVFPIIGDVLRRLPQWNGPTCGIGFATIIILYALEKLGKTWGRKHFVIKYISSSRAVIVLVIFTLVSYLVNKDRGKNLLWGITQISTHGIQTPVAPASDLISRVAPRSFAPLVASALEHLAVGKAFGRRNGYTIDQTQELNYLGVTNLVNSFFGAMPVGGAMSRTAVNSECRVRSPLSGLVTAGFILLTLYAFSPALYWLPKATLSAIIIMAVIHLFGPVSLFYRYWRVSLADFVASMVTFWLTIFISAEVGIGAGAGWSIVWTLLRSAFKQPAIRNSDAALAQDSGHSDDAAAAATANGTSHDSDAKLDHTLDTVRAEEHAGILIPDDVVVISFTDSVFYPNAARSKRHSLESIQLIFERHRLSGSAPGNPADRSWSVAADRRVERLRRERAVILREASLRVVVWDFGRVPFIDVTGVLALGELKDDIRGHCGKGVRFRVVGMAESVRERFGRASWGLVDAGTAGSEEPGADVVYQSLERAVLDVEGAVLEGVASEKLE